MAGRAEIKAFIDAQIARILARRNQESRLDTGGPCECVYMLCGCGLVGVCSWNCRWLFWLSAAVASAAAAAASASASPAYAQIEIIKLIKCGKD